MKNLNKINLLTALLLLATSVSAQTKVRGIVTDASTGEPLPFANVVLVGTTIGTITDPEGNYNLQTNHKCDSISFSMLGYQTYTLPISSGSYQEINVQLVQGDLMLNEIVIHPGENPAWRIMRNVEANRKKNNPDKLQSYKFQCYNKMEIDLNNVKDGFTKKGVMKNFDFIKNYADTSAETGKVFLPVFITETLSDVYCKSSPLKKKEVITASRVSGVESSNVSQFTGQMFIDVNIYKNYIPAFGHEFVSPVSDYWKANYKYYLLDSLYEDGHYLYHLAFKPKRKQEFTFNGELWINDSTWAVKKVKARISNGVNINFVNDLNITQEYAFVDSVWFLQKEELFVDFNLADSTMGFFGRRTVSRKNIEINPQFEPGTFSASANDETIVLDDALSHDTAFWNTERHEKLTQKEQDIYIMVDSIKEVPIFHTITNTINMFVTGYWTHSWWELGPYFKFYSHNPIEGHRFRFGGRTSNQFSTDIMFNAHIAYGTRDQKFKYGGGFMYMVNKNPRRVIEMQYKYDYEQLGQSINAFSEDNILSNLLARRENDHLLLVQELYYNYEHEYFQGFSNTVGGKFRKIYPSEVIPFKNEVLQTDMKHITSYEISLNTHFCYNEKFVAGEFLRRSMSSDYPALDINATVGFWNNKGSYDHYFRITSSIQQQVSISPIGKLKYLIEAGKIIGTVPFPLLKLHEGNETYAFDSYAFNMMNLYEFASDTYLSATLEHHFNGFFLNRIPLMRKLKWREIAYAKGLVGDISDKNSRQNALLDFPSTLGDVNKPYAEAGVGIENIFKFFRVDAIWRLTHLDNPDITKFAIMCKVQCYF
ncbi:MAG: carboxypeptidase-like regulatory domain-containing protein [Bacteroidales bacterium]|nr:carboxypeptidase-like regulatory domain-containing protein [Bacteroidales bacterium]